MKVGCLQAQAARKRKGSAFRDQPLLVDAKAGHVRLALHPAQRCKVDLAPHVYVERALEPRGARPKLLQPPDVPLKGAQAGDRARRDTQRACQGDKDLALPGTVPDALVNAAQGVVGIDRPQVRIVDVAMHPRLQEQDTLVGAGLVTNDLLCQRAQHRVVRRDPALRLRVGRVQLALCVIGRVVVPGDGVHTAFQRDVELNAEPAVSCLAEDGYVFPVGGPVGLADL